MDVTAVEQHVLPLREAAFANVSVRLDDAAGGGHEKSPGEVRGGFRQHVRGISDDHATPGRRGDIDVIEADGDVGGDLEVGAGGQEILVDGVRDHADQALAPLKSAEKLRPGQGRVDVVEVDVRSTSRARDGDRWERPSNQNGWPSAERTHRLAPV